MRRKPKSDVQVDIVTLVYGQPEFLQGLVDTILKVDAGATFKWIVVDNASPVETREALESIYAKIEEDERVVIVRSNRNLGFAGGCNLGAGYGGAPVILLLNSDIIIDDPGWLGKLISTLNSNPNIGIVGTKLLYFLDSTDKKRPAGTIQHAGVAFNIIGQAYHLCMGWPKDHPVVNVRREMNAVTGACLMTRRSIYKKLNGLDTDYQIGNFEDVDYCLKTRAMNYKVIYEPTTYLYHYAGGSGNSITAQRNAQLLQIKVGNLIEFDEYRYYALPEHNLPGRVRETIAI